MSQNLKTLVNVFIAMMGLVKNTSAIPVANNFSLSSLDLAGQTGSDTVNISENSIDESIVLKDEKVSSDDGKKAVVVVQGVDQTTNSVAKETEETTNSVAQKTEETADVVAQKTEETTSSVAKETDQTADVVAKETDQTANSVAQKTEETASSVAQKTEETADVVVPETDQTANSVAQKTEETTSSVAKETDQTANSVAQKTEETTDVVVPETDQTANSVAQKTDQTANSVAQKTEETTDVVVPETEETAKNSKGKEDEDNSTVESTSTNGDDIDSNAPFWGFDIAFPEGKETTKFNGSRFYPSFTITSPKFGNDIMWFTGSTQSICWDASAVLGKVSEVNVRIFSGDIIYSLKSTAASTGIISWNIGNKVSTNVYRALVYANVAGSKKNGGMPDFCALSKPFLIVNRGDYSTRAPTYEQALDEIKDSHKGNLSSLKNILGVTDELIEKIVNPRV